MPDNSARSCRWPASAPDRASRHFGFDKFVDRLPRDKAQLVVFNCGGILCTLSPNSLRKAEKLGYANLRVYREGLPEWQTRHHAMLTPQFLKAA